MRDYSVHVERTLFRDGHVLNIWRRFDRDHNEVLMADGTWRKVRAGELPDTETGVFLPGDAWRAICEAAAPHADAGEVKELRATVERESARVDQMIEKFLS